MDGEIQVVGLASCREDNRYLIIRGSKSRNKVAVGEPAAGSFFRCYPNLKTRGVRDSLSPPSHTNLLINILPLDPALSTAPTTCRDG